jgi:hypothetical protein
MEGIKVATYHKFEIFHKYKDGLNTGQIYLDGKELKGVRSIEVSIGVDEIPTVKLEFIGFNIDMDSEVQVDGEDG